MGLLYNVARKWLVRRLHFNNPSPIGRDLTDIIRSASEWWILFWVFSSKESMGIPKRQFGADRGGGAMPIAKLLKERSDDNLSNVGFIHAVEIGHACPNILTDAKRQSVSNASAQTISIALEVNRTFL